MVYEVEYFKVESGKEISWGHAVNSLDKLLHEVNNCHAMMIEADIHMQNGVAVMAHDKPSSSSKHDTFVQWLELISELLAKGNRIGIKLDFKEPSAVDPCLQVLQRSTSVMESNIPIWLNADILTGPQGKPCTFNAPDFISSCKRFQSDTKRICTLSIGWTTGAPHNHEQDYYTQAMVNEMVSLVHQFELQHVTFPVRAIYLKRSLETLHFLLSKCQGSTLTVWSSSESERVTHDQYQWIITNFNAKHTFIDVLKA